jgi:hypothetical protein
MYALYVFRGIDFVVVNTKTPLGPSTVFLEVRMSGESVVLFLPWHQEVSRTLCFVENIRL